MKILVVGATGATGRLLTKHLLDRDHSVKVIVRSAEKLTDLVGKHSNLTIIQASVLDLSDAEMAEHVRGCDAVASCLGHNINLKGIYGKPRRLVADATRRLCGAVKANQPDGSTKFVLMNTTSNRNRDLDEKVSFAEKTVVGLLSLLLPPQADNEDAAEFLRSTIGQNDTSIEWVAVRPDGLIDEDTVTEYELYPSPIRSAIFNAGKTSRINCAHFMADLITEDAVWQQWKGQMPVVYNKSSV
jgi:nucleoside-diphosphate-sugar epimerase